MSGVLGYAALAVLIGAALGVLRGPVGLLSSPEWLAIPIGLAVAVIVAVHRFVVFPRINQIERGQQLAVGLGIILAACALVAGTESAMTLSLPSSAGWIAGVSVGLSLVGIWIERDPSVAGAKLAVFTIYLGAGLTALSTLYTSLPPSAFWVVSAVIPAWQAKRCAARGDIEVAFRLLRSATRLLIWVLAIALSLPAALLFR